VFCNTDKTFNPAPDDPSGAPDFDDPSGVPALLIRSFSIASDYWKRYLGMSQVPPRTNFRDLGANSTEAHQ
jgi:hypothetical protein